MKKFYFQIAVYLLIVTFFFIVVALDVLNGKLEFQFYSDTATWIDEAIYGGHGDDLTMLNRNELGPVMILRWLGPNNYWAMFFFNVVVFLLSLYILSKDKDLNIKRMSFYIMISPITFSSLLSANKEIFALICTCLIIYNHKAKNFWNLFEIIRNTKHLWIYFCFHS